MIRFGALTLTAAALAAGCGQGPMLRPLAVHSAADAAWTVQVNRLNDGAAGVELVLEAEARAASPIAVERVSVAPVAAAPCAEPDTPAATLLVDGVPAWSRPLPFVGEHRLRIEVGSNPQLGETMAADTALDVAYLRDGAPACLRVPLVAAGDGAEWRPVGRVMAGVRLGGPHLTLGLRVGRWLGPLLLAAEGAVGPDRTSVAAFGQARVVGAIGLQLGAMGWWELSGVDQPRGSFRYGPRGAIQIWNAHRRERLGGVQVGVTTFDFAVARWLASGGQTPRTELMFEIGVWWNASGNGLGM